MRKTSLLLLAASFLITFMSCKTITMESDTEVYIEEVGDVTVTLQYLTKDMINDMEPSFTLTDQRTVHPLIIPVKGILNRDLLVFKITFTSEETTLFVKNTDIGLTMGEITDNSKNVNRFMTYWRGFLNDTDQNFMQARLKTLLLPDNIELTPDEPVEGYLVFFKNFPKGGGDAILEIPAETSTGESGVIQIPFKFYDPDYKGNSDFMNDEDSEDSENINMFDDEDFAREEQPDRVFFDHGDDF